jgi:hypothetical protein
MMVALSCLILAAASLAEKRRNCSSGLEEQQFSNASVAVIWRVWQAGIVNIGRPDSEFHIEATYWRNAISSDKENNVLAAIEGSDFEYCVRSAMNI